MFRKIFHTTSYFLLEGLPCINYKRPLEEIAFSFSMGYVARKN